MKFKQFLSERLSNRCAGKVFVFTGFRSAGLEDEIEEQGGKIGKSVTYDTTHLIMKKKGSGSGKENKVYDINAGRQPADKIVIWDEKQLEKFLAG